MKKERLGKIIKYSNYINGKAFIPEKYQKVTKYLTKKNTCHAYWLNYF